MKQLKSLVIVFLLFASYQVSAQAKVGHIDLQALMTSMPEMKTAQSQIEKIKEQYSKEYRTMVQEYQTKIDTYTKEAEAGTVTDAINETRTKEMQDMGGRIQQYQQNAEKELQQKELDLMKPLFEKAQAAIKKVAKEKGVNYVLDATSPGVVLFAEGGVDLMADVKKELKF
ncbi:MAG: OmpH family outer membrane protein [Flavobacterium sp.]|jgi:outer membrane protein|nr:OmpH family outer membrane protein [Flavobacterium sp.]